MQFVVGRSDVGVSANYRVIVVALLRAASDADDIDGRDGSAAAVATSTIATTAGQYVRFAGGAVGRHCCCRLVGLVVQLVNVDHMRRLYVFHKLPGARKVAFTQSA